MNTNIRIIRNEFNWEDETMDMLSRIEEILLLAIWKLEDSAYGIYVRA